MATVNPGMVSGTVHAPSSKSEFQRLLALSALSGNDSKIRFASKCNDVDAAIGIIQSLGCQVREANGALNISANRLAMPRSIHCGESGLLARMFAPVGALLCHHITLEGGGSLLQRDMGMIGEALCQLDLEVSGNKMPLTIKGRMSGGNAIYIDGSSSSQLLTGLLISLPFLNAHSTVVNVRNATSKPYIDLTIDVLERSGIVVKRQGYEQFIIPGCQKIRTVDATVEGDWSGAAFLLVAGAIAGNITLKGLNPNSRQADRAILDILKLAGARITTSNEEITVERSNLQGFIADATQCPDLFPPLAVLAAYSEGYTLIKGATRLLDKESNRVDSLISIFRTFGIGITADNDNMVIKGGKIKGGRVSSHNDHRIAMAAAIAALEAEQPVTIDHHEAVNKSFPGFFNILSQIQHMP